MSTSMVWYMKKGDLLPPLQVQFFNPDDTPRDIEGRLVIFRMGSTLEVPMISAGATITEAGRGYAEYQWVEGDTDEVGSFRAEFVLDGPETYPKNAYITVVIEDDIGV